MRAGGVAPAADVGLRPPGRQVWLLGLAVGAIFCWSVAGYVEYFPAAIDGEANDAIRSAQSLVQGLEKGLFWPEFRHRFRSYNMGLTPYVFPLVAYLGPDPLAYKWLNIAYFALALGALAVVFVRLNLPWQRSWLLALLPLLTILIPSLQMYRWHCVCLAGALALIQAAGAMYGSAARFYGSLALFAFLLAHYHGQMIYQAGLLGLVGWHLISPEQGHRRWSRVAGLVACAGLCWLLYAYQSHWTLFKDGNRATDEARLLHRLLEPERARIVTHALLEAPERFVTWPIFALLLVGVAGTFERAQRWPADRMALLLGGAGFSVHALCLPIVNPSCRCWYLLPFLWIGLNGLATSAHWLCRTLGGGVGTALAAAGLVALCVLEPPQYMKRDLQGTTDSPAVPWNTTHQIDYIFRHLARLEPEPIPTLHVLPGRAFSGTAGGFSRQLEAVQLDWRRARVEFREIETERGLRELLLATIEGRLRHREVVLYLSQLGARREWDPEKIQPALVGLPYECRTLDLQGPPLSDPLRCLTVRVRAKPQ